MTKRSSERPARPDRACAVCGVKLSAYNDNATCWAHTVEMPWKGPNTKPR